MQRRLAMAVLVVALWAADAGAEMILYDPILSFTGTVTQARTEYNFFDGLTVGSTFYGTISPLQMSDDPTRLNYIADVFFGYGYEATGIWGVGAFDTHGSEDLSAYSTRTTINHLVTPLGPGYGWNISALSFSFLDGWQSGTFHFDADGLLSTPDGIIDAPQGWSGTLDSIQRVPEPNALALMSVPALFLLRRRRQSATR